MPDERALLTLSGTYTLDAIAGVVDYWVELLGLDVSTELTPYAQLFQQLLDPASTFRRNRAGANVVCLRHEDLAPRGPQAGDHEPAAREIEARLEEIASALRAIEHAVPCLVLLGPSADVGPAISSAHAAFAERLKDVANLYLELGEHAMAKYAVNAVHDAASDRFGHVPFTPAAMAAMGTAIARWYSALTRAPIKVVAVDADHTLWSGVVGENGVAGVRIDAPYVSFQQALVEQERRGRLVCLLSKNEEADVREVFDLRPEMALKWSHLVAHRVDWNPKPANLSDLVAGLELGMDSVVFLDDNPVECAQMRAECPSVLTVRVPTDPQRLSSFSEHLWLFDQPRITAEDRGRTGKYRDTASRAEMRRGAESLQAFLDGLELVVGIEDPAADEIPRLSQLTQRTNQFNASLLRLDEVEVRNSRAEQGALHKLVRASDRFGDYGIVGQLRARADERILEVDLFMLSCRALGRGIEHRMLAAAGRHAQQLGLDEVAVLFAPGERNSPVRSFLEQAFGVVAQGDAFWFRMPAGQAAEVAFDASRSQDDVPAVEVEPAQGKVREAAIEDQGALYERIAHELTTAAAIEQAIARRVRPRPDGGTGFIAPAAGMEEDIASIWRQVLRLESVGSNDLFQELGGKSIHLVQVHRLLLDRLQFDVDIVTLFQYPTVSALATHLAARSARGNMGAAQERGMRMREARARANRNPGGMA